MQFITLVMMFALGYLVFVFLAERINPFIITSNSHRRSYYHLGLVAWLAITLTPAVVHLSGATGLEKSVLVGIVFVAGMLCLFSCLVVIQRYVKALIRQQKQEQRPAGRIKRSEIKAKPQRIQRQKLIGRREQAPVQTLTERVPAQAGRKRVQRKRIVHVDGQAVSVDL